jgi:hypothetical protein
MLHQLLGQPSHLARDRVVPAAELEPQRHHHAGDVAAAEDRVPARQRDQRGGRVGLPVDRRAHLAPPGLVHPPEHSQRQVLLAPELVVEGAAGVARLLSHLLEHQVAVAAARQASCGRLEQGAPRPGTSLGLGRTYTHVCIVPGKEDLLVDVPLVIAGSLALAGAAIHGIAGELLIVRKLAAEALPTTRFGGPRMTRAMIHAAWHLATVAFLSVGSALVLAGSIIDGDAAKGIALFGAAAATGFAAVVVGLGAASQSRLSFRSFFLHPGPAVLTSTAALAWWGAL